MIPTVSKRLAPLVSRTTASALGKQACRFKSRGSRADRSLALPVPALDFPLENLFNRTSDFMRLFDDDAIPSLPGSAHNMRIDIKEKEGEYEIVADMPGVD